MSVSLLLAFGGPYLLVTEFMSWIFVDLCREHGRDVASLVDLQCWTAPHKDGRSAPSLCPLSQPCHSCGPGETSSAQTRERQGHSKTSNTYGGVCVLEWPGGQTVSGGEQEDKQTPVAVFCIMLL